MWWTTALAENSPLAIALAQWVPAGITIVVGGVFASILLPRWQNANARFHAREARRLAIAEEMAKNMERYILSLNRLLIISRAECGNPLSDAEIRRKEGFLDARNKHREALRDSMCSISLYFSSRSEIMIRKFNEWDDASVNLTVDKAPPIDQWRTRGERVMSQIRSEVSSG